MEDNKKFNRLLIFDGSHALHRNLSVLNNWNMQTTTGIRTGGVFGVLRTLLKEISQYNYYPVFVFDGGLSKRRLQLYPNYKGTLDKQEKELLIESKNEYSEEDMLHMEMKTEYANQREMLKQILPFFNIPVICYENWEGDDLIYLLTQMSKDSIVVSDDKDLLQLIRDDDTGRCRVKRAMRDEFWDINTLKENSEDVNEYIIKKAIVGDQSDNIPSACYGVGEKTAKDLYKFYSYLIEHKIQYPTTEEELTTICKENKLTKRKAFINFSENQFLTNLMLTDLKLVDKDVEDFYPKMLYIIEENINSYFKNNYNEEMQLANIINILKYLEIRTFEYSYLFKLIKDVKDVIYNVDTNLSEKRATVTNINGLF